MKMDFFYLYRIRHGVVHHIFPSWWRDTLTTATKIGVDDGGMNAKGIPRGGHGMILSQIVKEISIILGQNGGE
jgi:hypothetical protein